MIILLLFYYLLFIILLGHNIIIFQQKRHTHKIHKLINYLQNFFLLNPNLNFDPNLL